MRNFMLAVSTALLVVVVSLTTQAAQREKQQAEAPKPVFIPKNSPAAERALAINLMKEQEKQNSYKGLSVEPHPEAEGDELAMQERIAALMARLDYVPAHHAEHFRWVHDEKGMPIYGWWGRIVGTERAPEGVVVTVRISVLAPFRTTDHTLETYLYNKAGRLVHLHSEGAPSRGLIIY